MIVERSNRGGRDWRAIAFRVVSGVIVLFVLVLMGGLFGLAAPWGGPGGEPAAAHPEIHRWHSAQWATLMAILLSGSLLAAIRRPRENPVLVQFAVLALIGFFLVATTVTGMEAEMLAFPIMAGLLALTYPAPRTLASFGSDRGMSVPLLALTVVATVVLLPDAWRGIQLQMAGGNEHAALGHWQASTIITLWIVVGGVLAATRGGGWRKMSTIIAIAFLYLGVAALSIPQHDGSWGTMGGIVSILGGVVFAAITQGQAQAHEVEGASVPAAA